MVPVEAEPAPPAQLDSFALLRILQFSSPTLPIGAFAYSQGLEQAVELGFVRDEAAALAWIAGLAQNALARLDVPVFGELYRAWQRADVERVLELSDFLQACRESSEILAEDRSLGAALARVLSALDVPHAERLTVEPRVTLAALSSLSAVHFRLPLESAALGYLFAWCENQVAAACRLVPLGHIAGQRVLSRLLVELPDAVRSGLALSLENAGFSAPGQAIASALHETAYCRLFRS
jgi:urease accessory protein